MEAVCIDGTVIEADNVKHSQGGVILQKSEPKKQVKQSKQSKKKKKQKQKKSGVRTRTVGFVPYNKLMYVVPEDASRFEEVDELPVY